MAHRLGVVDQRVLEVRGKLLRRLVGEAVAEPGEELVGRVVLHDDPLALHSDTAFKVSSHNHSVQVVSYHSSLQPQPAWTCAAQVAAGVGKNS